MSSTKLIRIAGIDVKIHWSFALIVGWVAYSYYSQGDGITGALFGVSMLMAVFACVVLHEIGHALAARVFGIGTEDITLLPIGGVARLRRMPEKPIEELIVAVAGPLVNVLIVAILYTVLTLIGRSERLATVQFVATTATGFLTSLVWINAALVVFNMLPAFPMDGGRVLRAVLAHQLPFIKATRWAAAVGQVMAVLFVIVGVTSNLFLSLIGLFVFFAARSEIQQVVQRSLLKGRRVANVTTPVFPAMRSSDSLHVAVNNYSRLPSVDFPVFDEAGLYGVLGRETLINHLRKGDADVRVGDVTSTNAFVVDSKADLSETLMKMRASGLRSIPVQDDGQFVGMMSLRSVNDFLTAQSAMNCCEERADQTDQ